MLRIRRIWQLANNKANYDDQYELGVEQLTNDFANMEYVNPKPMHGNEWFIGDIIPFERCAYIVNINSDGASAYFHFIRLTTAVMWDPILRKKLVVTQQDFVSDTYTKTLTNTISLPIYHSDMGYWPFKGSFFYFVKGTVYFLHDPLADMTDTCNFSDDRCDNSGLVDPCARDTPLFNTGTTWETYSYLASSATGN